MVSLYSTIKMMHRTINIRMNLVIYIFALNVNNTIHALDQSRIIVRLFERLVYADIFS